MRVLYLVKKTETFARRPNLHTLSKFPEPPSYTRPDGRGRPSPRGHCAEKNEA